jgi:AraC family transcriptional regulator
MKPDTRSFYVQAVQRAIDYVSAHLDEAVDLDVLAAEACLSRFHFHRVFRGMVGETPMELVRRLRLERAAWRLAHSGARVTEIAFDAGYETHEAFTRAFGEHYATPPSGFRDRQYPRIELAAPCGVHFNLNGHAGQFITRDSGGRNMTVEIDLRPELRVGTVHHTGPYNQIPEAFERLGATVGSAAGALRQRGAEMIAIYYDDPESVPPNQLRSDAGVTIPCGVNMPDGLVERRLSAGRYACAVHVGPYETLGDAWARFMGEWLPSSGERVADAPSYEVYLNDPTTTPKAELRTGMCLPLR